MHVRPLTWHAVLNTRFNLIRDGVPECASLIWPNDVLWRRQPFVKIGFSYCLVSSHCLGRCWHIVSRILTDKLQWNFSKILQLTFTDLYKNMSSTNGLLAGHMHVMYILHLRQIYCCRLTGCVLAIKKVFYDKNDILTFYVLNFVEGTKTYI